jgi:hypothetical protein
MTIGSTGNVGIGGAPGTSRLTVAGTSQATDLLATNSLLLIDSTYSMRAVAGQGIYLDTPGVVDPFFLQQGTGNVGIGTVSPGARLSIVGGGLHVGGTTDPGTGNVTVDGTFKLAGSSSGAVGFVAPAAAGTAVYTLPSADGSAGQSLNTNGAGVLSWGGGGSGGITGLSATGDVLTYQKFPAAPGPVSFVVQNDNPGMFSAVNPVTGSAGSPLDYSQININGSYVYPAASANSGFGGFLNFITRNLGGTSVTGAWVNGGMIGTTAGVERGDLDLGICGPFTTGALTTPCSGGGTNVPRVIGLRAESDGRLSIAVDVDNTWDLGGPPATGFARWRNGYFAGVMTSGSFLGTILTAGATGNPPLMQDHNGSVQNIGNRSIRFSSNGSFSGSELSGVTSLFSSANLYNDNSVLDVNAVILSESSITETARAFVENYAGRFTGVARGSPVGGQSGGVMGTAYSYITAGAVKNYAAHFDIFDRATGGTATNVAVNIEFPFTSTGSTNIGINMQPNATVTGVRGIQFQTIGGATTYACLICSDAVRMDVAFDIATSTIITAVLGLPAGIVNATPGAHSTIYGWFPVVISGGLTKYMPVYN